MGRSRGGLDDGQRTGIGIVGVRLKATRKSGPSAGRAKLLDTHVDQAKTAYSKHRVLILTHRASRSILIPGSSRHRRSFPHSEKPHPISSPPLTPSSPLSPPSQTTSISSATSRQLRRIRAGVDRWREREAYEELCRRGVEEWEAKRLREGLRGIGAKEILGREVREFEGELDDWGTRIGEMRGGVTVA